MSNSHAQSTQNLKVRTSRPKRYSRPRPAPNRRSKTLANTRNGMRIEGSEDRVVQSASSVNNPHHHDHRCFATAVTCKFVCDGNDLGLLGLGFRWTNSIGLDRWQGCQLLLSTIYLISQFSQMSAYLKVPNIIAIIKNTRTSMSSINPRKLLLSGHPVTVGRQYKRRTESEKRAKTRKNGEPVLSCPSITHRHPCRSRIIKR
jgi:hypothetical protein